MAMIRSAKNAGRPTSFTAIKMTLSASPCPPSVCHSSNFLWVCSTTTMAASTSAPVAIDDVDRVRALAHDDDAGHGLPAPVEVGHPTAHFRPDRDLADVLHAHDLRGPAARRHHRLVELTRIIQIAAPADHVLGAA